MNNAILNSCNFPLTFSLLKEFFSTNLFKAFIFWFMFNLSPANSRFHSFGWNELAIFYYKKNCLFHLSLYTILVSSIYIYTLGDILLLFFFWNFFGQLALGEIHFKIKMTKFRMPRNEQPVISAKMPKLPPKLANLSHTECRNSTE